MAIGKEVNIDMERIPRGLSIGTGVRVIVVGQVSGVRESEDQFPGSVTIRSAKVTLEPLSLDDAANMARAAVEGALTSGSEKAGTGGTTPSQ